MICASSINVKPVSLSLEVGKWYYGAKASICPPTATCKCVRWRSDNESVATVNPSTGYIYAKKVGTATIYAAATDGSGKTGRLNITVKCNVLVTGIYLGKLCLTLEKGDQYTFKPTVYPSNATNKTLEWSSKNTNIVRVNGSTITAVGLGTTSVVAKATDGSGVSASCTVTVAKQDILVKSITVYPHSGTLTVGNSASLSATVCPEDAENKNVVWSSSNTSIATVNPNSGLVYAKKAGNVIIYADADDGGGARDTCCITVKGVVPVRGVTVSPTHTDMYVGQSQYLSYGIIPENATLKRVSWCSDNDSVVSVGASSGRVVANKPGTAVITVKTADGGYTAKCIISVTKAPVIFEDDGFLGQVVFKDTGKVWRCISNDMIYDENNKIDTTLKERSNYNIFCEYNGTGTYPDTIKEFTDDELRLLFAIDPYGVAEYVDRYAHLKGKGELSVILAEKDRVFKVLFKREPKYFARGLNNEWYETTNKSELHTVLSESETLFGMHPIYDWTTVIELAKLVLNVAGYFLGVGFASEAIKSIKEVYCVIELMFALGEDPAKVELSSMSTDVLISSLELIDLSWISDIYSLSSSLNSLAETIVAKENYSDKFVNYCAENKKYSLGVKKKDGNICWIEDVSDAIKSIYAV